MVLSGGTYSGNPLSAAAGQATLAKLDTATFARLDFLGERMRTGVNADISSRTAASPGHWRWVPVPNRTNRPADRELSECSN